ncbi:hypothetical protein Bra471DRAFT_03524 [Bradyrhizobium sp. WSM471]|nr:hypothetical protein Bra471DRAFT_03524 [Bradyrhizobium sp. WSM471]
MAGVSSKRPAARSRRRSPGSGLTGGARRPKRVQGDAKGEIQLGSVRVEAVMRAAEQSGLLSRKSGRIAGRVSPALIRQAKRQTGIVADTDLIEFALASIALEDNFAEDFRKSRGKVDPDLKLGF